MAISFRPWGMAMATATMRADTSLKHSVGTLAARATLGLSIRATGDNADMVRASSINPAFTITVFFSLTVPALKVLAMPFSFSMGSPPSSWPASAAGWQ